MRAICSSRYGVFRLDGKVFQTDSLYGKSCIVVKTVVKNQFFTCGQFVAVYVCVVI